MRTVGDAREPSVATGLRGFGRLTTPAENAVAWSGYLGSTELERYVRFRMSKGEAWIDSRIHRRHREEENRMRTQSWIRTDSLIAGLLSLLAVTRMAAESISVANPSFETIALANPAQDSVHFTADGKLIVGAFTQPATAPFNVFAVPLAEPVSGWTTAGLCGITALSGGLSATEGRNVGYIDSLGTIFQSLTNSLAAGTVYQFEADIAGAAGVVGQSYTLALVVDGVAVASASGIPVSGSFTHVSRSFTIPVDSPYAGRKMGVAVGNATPSLGRIYVDSVSLSARAISGPAPLPSGAVGWWRGESETNVVDLKAGTFRAGGLVGPGFVGNGFAYQGGYSALVLPPAFSMPSQDFSVECWIRRGSATVAGNDFEAGELFGGSEQGFTFGLTHEGRLYLSHVGVVSFYSTTRLIDREWHHVGVVRRGTLLEFYADGVLTDKVPCAVNFRLAGPYAIGGLGTPYFGVAYGFLGSIDELAVYGRALSLSEMQSIYSAQTAGKVFPTYGFGVLPVPQSLVVGIPQQFGASLTNLGSSPLTNVVLSGGFSAGTEVLSIGASVGTPTRDGNLVQVQRPVLAPGEWLTLSIEARPDSAVGVGFTNHFEGRFLEKTLGSVAILVDQSAPLTSTPVPIPPGAVALWRFEGGSTDSLGRVNGLLSGHASFVDGIVGRALALDGIDSSVQLGLAPELQLADLTIEGWVRRAHHSSISQGFSSVGFIIGGGFGSYGLGMNSNGSLQFGKLGPIPVTSSSRITDLEWHHVAVSKSGLRLTLYLDGTASGTGLLFDEPTFGTPFAIGALG